MVNRAQKITLAEMRDMGFATCWSTARITMAAIQSRSVAIVGRITSGCPSCSSAKRAGHALPNSGRTSLEQDPARKRPAILNYAETRNANLSATRYAPGSPALVELRAEGNSTVWRRRCVTALEKNGDHPFVVSGGWSPPPPRRRYVRGESN
jgi:hypothetical protein